MEEYVFHRAVRLKFRDGVKVEVTFEDGKVMLYDMAKMYDKYPQLRGLEDRALFESGELDHYGIIWNDELDFEAESIYHEGTLIRQVKPFPNVDIGSEIAGARAARDMSQKELAKKLGLDQSDVSKIERGVSNISLKTLRKIADALDCNVVVKLEPKDPNDPDFYPPDLT